MSDIDTLGMVTTLRNSGFTSDEVMAAVLESAYPVDLDELEEYSRAHGWHPTFKSWVWLCHDRGKAMSSSGHAVVWSPRAQMAADKWVGGDAGGSY